MKITIISEGKKLPIIRLPLSLIKHKLVQDKLGIDDLNGVYKTLKNYIKENGHFTLIELESNDNYLKLEV